MKLSEAFPTFTVRLYCDDKDPGTVFAVRHAAGGRMTLEGTSSEVRLPAQGQAVQIQMNSDGTLYRVAAQVVEREEGERPRLTIEQAGTLEEVQRRRSQRVPVQWPVRLEGAAGTLMEPLELLTEDANYRGARVASPVELPLQSAVHVRLHPVGGEEFRCMGRVVRCEPSGEGYEIGVRFEDLSDSERERLVQALLQQLFLR